MLTKILRDESKRNQSDISLLDAQFFMIQYIKAIRIQISKPSSSFGRGPLEKNDHYSSYEAPIFISGITVSVYRIGGLISHI